jgi:hypothetical protein
MLKRTAVEGGAVLGGAPTPLAEAIQATDQGVTRARGWSQTLPIPPSAGLMSDSSTLDPSCSCQKSEFADTPHGPVSANHHEHVWLPVKTTRINGPKGYTEYKTYLCACGGTVKIGEQE